MILLLGSVLANVLQLVAFGQLQHIFGLFGKQHDGSSPLHRARSSYRRLVGRLTAPFGAKLQQQQHADSSTPLVQQDGDAASLAAQAPVGAEIPAPRAAAQSPPPPPAPLARHPQYRLAFTVPWVGKAFPSWFPYFLSSCRRSAFIADWLIFHEDAQLPPPEAVPPNVIFHNLGKQGLGQLFGSQIAKALNIDEPELAQRLVSLFQLAFREFAYIVTEYKPTHGTVFASYLSSYSHWSYTDIDMLIGDLPLHVELDELANYDIFTYHFGDAFRLYLRGQFAAHRNEDWINRLWAQCPHLGAGLVRELESKAHIVRRLAAEGKHGRTRFISAEGCYSWVVASEPGMRVKFASKAFADWSDDREFYVVDGAVRKCPKPSLVWLPKAAAAGGEAPDGDEACTPFGPRIAPHTLEMRGVQRPLAGSFRPVTVHRECSRWVEERYRLCADLPEEEEESRLYNVLLANGSWSAHKFVNDEPAHSLEGAFLHLQRWKGDYKRLTYGERGMPPLGGRRVFKLSRFGVGVYDVEYDNARGADMSEVTELSMAAQKDVTDMDDDEFEAQLGTLRTAVREAGGRGRRKGGRF